MKRQVIYSASKRVVEAGHSAATPAGSPVDAITESVASRSRITALRARIFGLDRTHRVLALLVVIGLVFGLYRWAPSSPPFTQEAADAAVFKTLENKALPSRAAKAAETIRPAVVLVRGFVDVAPRKRGAKPKPRTFVPESGPHGTGDKKPKPLPIPEGMEEFGVGTGVVVVDDGTILTNLHVIRGTRLVRVVFHDGTESDAEVVGVHPENDLAVIKAKTLPDDLAAATLGSAGRLKPGDEVVAVGFPFGIGPSVSSGVVSGLDREFRSPKGERVLTKLIQFDAAANPGNSGGPLVTMQGDVVGIVTAILNPTEAGTFVGIGFAVTIGAAGNSLGMPPF